MAGWEAIGCCILSRVLILYFILVLSTLAVVGVAFAVYALVKRHLRGSHPGVTKRIMPENTLPSSREQQPDQL